MTNGVVFNVIGRVSFRARKNTHDVSGVFRRIRLSWIFLAFICASVLTAAAHLPSMAAAQVAIRPDGKFTLDLTFDLPPFVLDISPQNATDAAMELVARWLNQCAGKKSGRGKRTLSKKNF